MKLLFTCLLLFSSAQFFAQDSTDKLYYYIPNNHPNGCESDPYITVIRLADCTFKKFHFELVLKEDIIFSSNDMNFKFEPMGIDLKEGVYQWHLQAITCDGLVIDDWGRINIIN